MKNPRKADNKDAQEAITGGESIDQIREILFGSMQREVMNHLDSIEKRFEKENLERTKQIETTKKSFDQKLQKLSENITAKLDQLKSDLKDSQKENHIKLTDANKEINGNISKSHDELKSSLSEHAEEIKASLNATHSEFERAIENLEKEKTGKSSLGDYLLEIGMRLKGDTTLNAISSSVAGNRSNTSNDHS